MDVKSIRNIQIPATDTSTASRISKANPKMLSLTTSTATPRGQVPFLPEDASSAAQSSIAETAWPSKAAHFVRVSAAMPALAPALLGGLAQPSSASETRPQPEISGVQAVAPALDPSEIYVWMDLGNVLLDTRDPAGTKLMPGALEYIRELQNMGYKVGLITNIPASWGKPGDYASKRAALQSFIRDNWIDTRNPPIDLDAFDEVYLPLTAEERKPAAKLFDAALSKAQSMGRVGIYSGETASEIEAAKKSGMAGFLIRYDDQGRAIYLPPKQIPEYIEEG